MRGPKPPSQHSLSVQTRSFDKLDREFGVLCPKNKTALPSIGEGGRMLLSGPNQRLEEQL